MRYVLLLVLSVGSLLAQEIKLPPSIDKLADKATQVVDVSLDGQMLQLASKFLSGNNPDEARVKRVVSGLKGIYVKSFEFENEGEYSHADVEEILRQLRTPGWSRMVGVVNKKEHEHADIYVKSEGDRIAGLVVVAAEPKELTVVHIVGSISLEDLSELGGHFGVPEVSVPAKKAPAPKE
jgi:hypothetical protein